MSNSEDMTIDNLRDYLDSELASFLDARDGAASFLEKIPNAYSPESILHRPGQPKPESLRIWELVAVFYKNKGRLYEALSILSAMYDHMVLAQNLTDDRCHKGMPLIWMSVCYKGLGFPVLSKRYLMLALIEAAITEQGVISPDTTGTYFRLVWEYGLPDLLLRQYAARAFHLSKEFPIEGLYPEWILQDLDHNWMVEYPAPTEGAIYRAHPRYVNYLIERLGEGTGSILERLAEYLLACMPGCRTMRRQRSKSTDYDIVCSMDGFEIDFRSEFGRYFVCECKDWKSPADFTTMAKFCRVLDSVKARFGIIFSKHGISGANTSENAEREQIKVFQDRGMVIVVVDMNDLLAVASGANFVNILRDKYEKVRLDLVDTKSS